MLKKPRSIHKKTLSSRKNKIYSMHPIDKTIICWMNFVLKGTWEENTGGCSKFSSMWWVLVSPQHFRSKISLSWWCRKPRQKWNWKGAPKKMVAKYNNDGGSKSDKKYRSRVIFRQQRMINEWKNPSIYNKILS